MVPASVQPLLEELLPLLRQFPLGEHGIALAGASTPALFAGAKIRDGVARELPARERNPAPCLERGLGVDTEGRRLGNLEPESAHETPRTPVTAVMHAEDVSAPRQPQETLGPIEQFPVGIVRPGVGNYGHDGNITDGAAFEADLGPVGRILTDHESTGVAESDELGVQADH